MKTFENIQRGKEGESLVTQSLEKDGYTILTKNFRIRGGEIDIIAKKNEVLAFVEVKSRRTIRFPLSQVVTLTKQKTIIRTAKHFLAQSRQTIDTVYRFDVALVTLGDKSAITYIPNAFMGE